MKKLVLIVAMVMFLGMGTMAQATLINRGGGLIYDNDRNITWLQDATYAMTSGYDADGMMTWAQATTWAENLVYGGYTDWRLPTTVDGPFFWGNDGTTTGGYNITTSEMGYMYYVNLENLGFTATDGTEPQEGWGLIHTSPFNNLQPGFYWSSATAYFTDPIFAWDFNFSDGFQGYLFKPELNYAWAVRPGDSAPVPEPATIGLLSLGALALMRKRRA